MKPKSLLALLLALALLSGSSVLAADPGSAADPLIALNWLKNTFIPNTSAQAEEKIDARYSQIAADTVQSQELLLKKGDVLRLDTGSMLIPLAGTLSATASGTLIDVSEGETLPASGGALSAHHRYLTAEKTTAACSVTSNTAVIRLAGIYQLSPSGETDYNALAGALRDMGLFKGTDTPYGSGYDLELTPTRIQGLIMFLRLLGEEKAALAYSGTSVTFTDVPDWALPYASYAYAKGYTKGQGTDDRGRVQFGSETALGPGDYMTFLLRALGYQEETDFRWASAIADAHTLGVLTEGESRLLTQQPFLRAQVVYLSYFALSAKLAGGRGPLLDRLISAGSIEKDVASAAMKGLSSQRL